MVASGLVAQDSRLVEIDHIAAVVGRVAIPFSRVEEGINVMRARGETVPSDSAGLAALRREIVERLVDEELMIQQAQTDTSIRLTDEQVQSAAEDAIRQVRMQFRSDVDFERQLRTSGFGSSEEYRRWISDQRRRDLLQQTLIAKLRERGVLKPVPPTDAELRVFYEKVKGGQVRPAVVSFRQIVIRPQPDSAAVAAARRLADSLAQAVRGGADVATLAKRFSEDPGSKEQGGELGWVRRGQMVPEFEYWAFTLRPGQVSPPVLTTFGFHVIQVEHADPAEVQVRHMLIVPKLTEANIAAAKTLIDSLAALVKKGASFDSLARRYNDPHDPTEQTFAQSVIVDSLPPVYRTPFAAAKPGDIIGPLTLERQAGQTRYSLVRLDEMRPAGQYAYEELRDRIRNQLAEENAIRRYLNGLRKSTYVDIRL
jgi:peptidyl-prolyl cis-trans isomerase SurA